MPAPARWTLPDHPDLDHLRRRAKRLRDEAAADDPAALDLVATYDPPADAPVPLARAQRVLARAYGFAGWTRLVEHVRIRVEHTRPMAGHDDHDGPVDRFLRRAVLSYTEPDRSAEAAALVADDPALATASVHTLAACGRADELRGLLAADAGAVRHEGGPHRWVPLLYACYARVPQTDAAGTVTALLAAGADPDAGFLWQGMPSPFTAVTGVLGGGERDEPPHPDATRLVTLLLDAGADPNDNQALYNRAFRPADDHLPPLFAHGLGTDRPSPWRERLGTAYPSPAQMVGEHLRCAASSGFVDRVRLLLDRGVDPDTRGYHPIHRDRTPYAIAVRAGHAEVAALLADAGARTDGPSEVDRLVAAALAGDLPTTAAASPGLRARAVEKRPDALATAAEHHGPAALAALLDLGFPVDAAGKDGRTALHQAALDGNAELCRWLTDHGADRTLRDARFDANPAGWAAHAGHEELAAALAPS